MGAARKFVDAVLFVFFIVIAVVVPLLDAQTCLPDTFFPKSLVELKSWYSVEYGDYLMAEKPGFFVGLAWVQLLFAWPLSLLNLYAILAGASWFPTTCLIYGASTVTAMTAIMAEIVTSGRASEKLLLMYYPFLGLGGLAILRGLFSRSKTTTSPVSTKPSKKKRA